MCVCVGGWVAHWEGSQHLSSLSKNSRGVVRPFSFVCFTARMPIFTFCTFFDPSVNVLYWLTMLFAKVKRRSQLQQEPVETNSAATQLPFKPMVIRSICRKMHTECRITFLLTLYSPHNTWNLNASISDQVLLCFVGKYFSFPQKPTTSTKVQVVPLQKMGGKAILSDA